MVEAMTYTFTRSKGFTINVKQQVTEIILHINELSLHAFRNDSSIVKWLVITARKVVFLALSVISLVCFVCYRQHCAKRKAPVFNLLRGRFWGFSPCRGDTLHRWEAKFCVFPSPPSCQISPSIGAMVRVQDPQNWNFYWNFDQNVKCEGPAGAYTLRDFHKICRVSTPFQDTLAVKISLDLLKALRSWGF